MVKAVKTKCVNLALQGGGAHGAFGWGVLDCLLSKTNLNIEAISATSAGAMNACVYAYGNMVGGPEGARTALHNFWQLISKTGYLYSPVKPMPWENAEHQWNMNHSFSFALFEATTRLLSPYQFNPLNVNPLKEILLEIIDFDKLRQCQKTKLFLSATNVRTGKVKIFKTDEVTVDVVLASACLPFLFQAIEIDGEFYWDGGYMGNPALFPLVYHTHSQDVVIVHINPIERAELPVEAPDIINRLNEITFNASLLKEMCSIAFVNKLLEEGWLRSDCRTKLKHMFVHSIRSDKAMCGLSVASKFNTEWTFLQHLHQQGHHITEAWLTEHLSAIGHSSTVDLTKEFSDLGSDHIG